MKRFEKLKLICTTILMSIFFVMAVPYKTYGSDDSTHGSSKSNHEVAIAANQGNTKIPFKVGDEFEIPTWATIPTQSAGPCSAPLTGGKIKLVSVSTDKKRVVAQYHRENSTNPHNCPLEQTFIIDVQDLLVLFGPERTDTKVARGDEPNYRLVSAGPDSNGRKCYAYLAVPPRKSGEENKKLPLVVYYSGSGEYDLDLGHPSLRKLFDEGKIAVLLTMRPGAGKSGTQVNNRQARDPKNFHKQIPQDYLQHLPSDIVHCGVEATEWAANHALIDSSKKITFVGHSEGVSMVSRIYLNLLRKKSPLVGRIGQLVLSGAWFADGSSLKKWRSTPEYQDAKRKKDEKYFLENAHLPYNYSMALEQSNLAGVYDELRSLNAPAKFRFIHCAADKNCSVDALRENLSRNQISSKPIDMAASIYPFDESYQRKRALEKHPNYSPERLEEKLDLWRHVPREEALDEITKLIDESL